MVLGELSVLVAPAHTDALQMTGDLSEVSTAIPELYPSGIPRDSGPFLVETCNPGPSQRLPDNSILTGPFTAVTRWSPLAPFSEIGPLVVVASTTPPMLWRPIGPLVAERRMTPASSL